MRHRRSGGHIDGEVGASGAGEGGVSGAGEKAGEVEGAQRDAWLVLWRRICRDMKGKGNVRQLPRDGVDGKMDEGCN
jgi:hypothetical protein